MVVLTIKAIMKPGHAHITMKIINIAQRINPNIVVWFYRLDFCLLCVDRGGDGQPRAVGVECLCRHASAQMRL